MTVPLALHAQSTRRVERPATRGVGRPGVERPGAFGEVLLGMAAAPRATNLPSAATAPAATLPGVVALPDPEAEASARRREARRRASMALAELEGLQRDLLGGRVDRARLERVAALAAAVPAGADAVLSQLADEIALRARIELARVDAAEARLASGGGFTRG